VQDEPRHGFEDSRRLPGPNRYFEVPAVTLTALGMAASDTVAVQAWAARVRAMAAALGWADPLPVISRRSSGTILSFKAPRDALLTATDVNEWAWERAAAQAGESSFDLAQDLGEDAAEEFIARAETERVPQLAALRAAAASRRLPVFEDDAAISIGAGTGSRCWPRTQLPEASSVPWSELSDVPTTIVTGSNGKTTTVRLIAAMEAAHGLIPGYCCTEGVFVGGSPVALGDYSGPDGARVVLRNQRVQAAVLETARGGILRRGLAVQRADVAVITNVRADHFGEYGIDSAEDLAETKLAVAHTVGQGGTLVLNADDATLIAAAKRSAHCSAIRLALFAADDAHPALKELRGRGGSTCAVRDGVLVLHHQARDEALGEIAKLPLTLNGVASYNIANLAAAALAGCALALPMECIAGTVRRFGSDPKDNPGRLECWRHRGAVVLIDYAHNPDALAQLLRTARALHPKRLLLLLGQAGNRGDDAIDELSRTAAAFAPDRVMIKELALMLRGRAPGEVPALIKTALLAGGVPADRIHEQPDEERAALELLGAAGPGDVVVLPIHTRQVRENLWAVLQR
jgi:cyanophycin synthetase